MTRIDQALGVAARNHQGQRRKDLKGTPYIVHPMMVGFLLHEHVGDEDVTVAGILHDVLEDTPYTDGELEKDFGDRVLRIVLAVSEPKRNNESDLPWKDRKLGYLENLRAGPKEAYLVSAADKIHNLSSLEREARTMGAKAYFDRFMSREPEASVWFYGEVAKLVEGAWPEHPLSNLLRETYDRVVPVLRTK